jgi:transposase
VGTVVEQYSLNGKYGYSLEGFDLPNITLEVSEEQISDLPVVKNIAITV